MGISVEDWLGKDNKLGIDIWKNKYQFTKENGERESFEDWLDRISNGNKKIRERIIKKQFLFGGRILANRQLSNFDVKNTYSNCYVIAPPEDSIEAIFKTASELARTYSYGGGCGIDISKLAPKGAKVRNTAKRTSGSVSFMELYSLVTSLIGQNGRRGALMISLDCTHPDIEDFITCKSDLDKINSANISVRMNRLFMKSVIEKKPLKISFTREATGETVEKTIEPSEVFTKLCYSCWDTGEPGILFWDTINEWNLLSEDKDFEYAGTNPCAEEPLPAGGSCLLGSINLDAFVTNGEFDYKEFKATVHDAIVALNEVLDEGMNLHPLKIQRETVRDWRQIGLGIMGLADMLIDMGIEYGSKESIKVCDKIGKVMADSAIMASASIPKIYPNYKEKAVTKSKYFIYNTYASTKKYVKNNGGLANSQLLTIAPTGSISTMLGVSGGIEPIFANYYERKTQSLHGKDVIYKVYTPIVMKYMQEHNITDDKDLPNFFVTASNILPKDRINMQAVWQTHIDASISSTINLPNETTVDEVKDIYLYAYSKGLKGVTIFRDGCRRAGVLTTATEEKKEELKWGDTIKISNLAIGKERHLNTGCGTLHCNAFFDPKTGKLLETYLSKGSTGGCQSNLTAVSRLISLLARKGADAYEIADQLLSCMVCPSYAVRTATKHDTSAGSSCPSAVGKAIIDMYEEMLSDLKLDDKIKEDEVKSEMLNTEVCPKCGEKLIRSGGCVQCNNCGWSKCE